MSRLKTETHNPFFSDPFFTPGLGIPQGGMGRNGPSGDLFPG